MLRIHQPYIKRIRYFTLASIGVLLLGGLVMMNSSSESTVYAAGDSRTIHDIENMQDMTQQICSNTKEGDGTSLLDSRGGTNNYYRVIKMDDGVCWMTENLRLKGDVTITSIDSQVESDYTLPSNAASDASVINWNTDNNTAYMAEGATNMKVYSSGGKWQLAYGNYYSWCAATAMSCKHNRTGAALNNTEAAESICPRGWKLPARSDTGSFQNLYNKYLNSATAGWANNQTIPYNGSTITGYNGLKLGNDSASALFSAAGNVGFLGLGDASYGGYYWSSEAHSDTGLAYALSFSSGSVTPQSSSARYFGFSVRCVAEGGLDKIEKPLFTTSENTNVNVNVPSILTIDAVSSFAETMPESHLLEGSISATVSSNTDYIVQLNAKDYASLTSTESTSTIDPVSSTNPVEAGKYNAWGFWDGNSNPKIYRVPLATSMTEIPSVESAGENNSTIHTYHLGISITPSLPSGIYATDVIITASTK